MPIYEYACEACGHRFEKLMRIGADAPPCPSCEAAEVKKLVSAAAFVLKGSGWYKDHYGLKKGGSGGSGTSSGDSGGSADGGGSTTTKSTGDSGSTGTSSSTTSSDKGGSPKAAS